MLKVDVVIPIYPKYSTHMNQLWCRRHHGVVPSARETWETREPARILDTHETLRSRLEYRQVAGIHSMHSMNIMVDCIPTIKLVHHSMYT